MSIKDKIASLPIGEYIGMKLSGGADSSILYYALCKHIKDNNLDTKIIVVTLDTDFKNLYIAGANRVIGIVKDLTGIEPYEHFTVTVPHSDENYTNGQAELVAKAKEKYGDLEFFTGLTKNPPAHEMRDYFIENASKHGLDFSRIEKHLDVIDTERDDISHSDQNPYRVFGATDKKGTASAYEELGMMEKLYPYTFSCENAPYELLDEKGNHMHCGECFFCLERYWGFGRIV